MFGYVTVYEPELKVKELQKYKAYYCGLCRTLKERHGKAGQMTLTYDMTFAVILLTSLYEQQEKCFKGRCMVHPVRGREILQTEIMEYCADMNLLLAYYHLIDDWKDERKFGELVGAAFLKQKARMIAAQYPRQSRAICRELKKLSDCEKKGIRNMDLPAGCFGRLMEELFVYRQDVWEQHLRNLGFYLGKFIYLMDAWEDLPEDLKKRNYNPLLWQSRKPDYEKNCREILCMMMGEASAAFEALPCLRDAEILRNILYAGVWKRYRKLLEEREHSVSDTGHRNKNII